MHGFPVQRTVNENYFTPSTPNHLRHPQSSVVDCRNKGHGSETRLARYLAENFRYDANNLSNWIYSTQLLQSEAYGYAYRDWKRKFAGKGKEECAGALVWQFNDVYPTTSWAFVDYYLRPKPAACTIRRACADLSVGSSRTPSSRWFNEDRPDEPRIPSFEIFAHNMTAKDIRCMLVIKAYDFAMRKWTLLSPDEKERGVTLQAGYSTELVSIGPHASWSDDSLIVLQSSLVDLATNKVLARYVDWPEPYRYLYWPKDTKVGTSVQQNVRPGVSVASSPQDWESFVTVWSNQPIKGCWLEPVYDGKEAVDGPEPLWEDNMFDIMPDEEMVVGVNGLRDRGVKVRFLYDWELK
jgi:beta-mannosidase